MVSDIERGIYTLALDGSPALRYVPGVNQPDLPRRPAPRVLPGKPLPPAPCVSVIVPCYNYGRLLAEAVASVLQQTLSDLELIIIDDGSTDDTASVIAGLNDARVRHRCLPANRGVSAARNAGLDMARGEYLAFLDADDRWLPEKLARQVALMDAEPEVAIAFTDFVRFSLDGGHIERQFDFVPEFRDVPTRPARAEGGRVVEGDAFVALGPLAGLPAWIQTDLLRASLTRDLRFAEPLRLAEDLHYIMRAYTRGAAAFLPDALAEVRRHGTNSYSVPAEMLQPVLEALQMLEREALSPPQRRALRTRIARAWRGIGYHEFWNGRVSSAVSAYARAAAMGEQRRDALRHVVASPAAVLLRRMRPHR